MGLLPASNVFMTTSFHEHVKGPFFGLLLLLEGSTSTLCRVVAAMDWWRGNEREKIEL